MITDNLVKWERNTLNSLKEDNKKWETLKSISHLSIEDLCKQNPNLLVFPHCLKKDIADFCDKPICEIVGDKITTHNIVGFIGAEDIDISIRSRFAKSGLEDYFLHYMLQKVFKVNILDLQHSGSNEDVFDFALYLFPHYFKRAMKQGLYKQYCKREYNDANVRGAIDVSRHIRHNTPFNGRIAYRTREYQYDNPLMQLIRHTIEYIRTHKWAGNILKCDKDMCDYVRTIYDITPSYKANDRQRVIAQNDKPVTHPFYTEYRVLQQLCLQILRRKGIKYGVSDNKIYGILFDCAWLWEEYLATIMPEGFVHAVRGIECGYQFFKGLKSRYPDFYSFDKQIVLDAKYKKMDSGWGQREDQFQLIAYMHTFHNDKLGLKGAKFGALIYPTDNDKVVVKSEVLYGYGGIYATIPILIPTNEQSYNDFFNKMEMNRLVLTIQNEGKEDCCYKLTIKDATN